MKFLIPFSCLAYQRQLYEERESVGFYRHWADQRKCLILHIDIPTHLISYGFDLGEFRVQLHYLISVRSKDVAKML